MSDVWKSNFLHLVNNEPEKMENGSLKFTRNNTFHNIAFPSLITFDKKHRLKELCFCEYGCYHNEDGPALIEFRSDGSKKLVEFQLRGKMHRAPIFLEKGGVSYRPAMIRWYESGIIQKVMYAIDGNIHNEYGPAICDFYKNGNIKRIEFRIHNKTTRDNGPAIIHFNEDGTISKKEYLIDGNYIKNAPHILRYHHDGRLYSASSIVNFKTPEDIYNYGNINCEYYIKDGLCYEERYNK